jgi:SAM-dependent methyltransferase
VEVVVTEPGQEPARQNPATGDLLAAAMHEYYELGEEAERLARSGPGRLEFERTCEIVLRHLPPAPATIADIGGGPGRYTLWLAARGYQVLHRDIVPLHVQQLSALIAGADVQTALGDARSLDLPDDSVDAVLLLGPLYHLPQQADRVQALREAGRIVRTGGPVFAAAISRWAARLDGILRVRLYERTPDAVEIVDTVERTGVLPPLTEKGFPGYTHRPGELREECAEAGLEVSDLVAVEGAGYLIGDLEERMSDPRAWEVVLSTARAHERVPELLGVGSHLLVTGRKP